MDVWTAVSADHVNRDDIWILYYAAAVQKEADTTFALNEKILLHLDMLQKRNLHMHVNTFVLTVCVYKNVANSLLKFQCNRFFSLQILTHVSVPLPHVIIISSLICFLLAYHLLQHSLNYLYFSNDLHENYILPTLWHYINSLKNSNGHNCQPDRLFHNKSKTITLCCKHFRLCWGHNNPPTYSFISKCVFVRNTPQAPDGHFQSSH